MILSKSEKEIFYNVVNELDQIKASLEIIPAAAIPELDWSLGFGLFSVTEFIQEKLQSNIDKLSSLDEEPAAVSNE